MDSTGCFQSLKELCVSLLQKVLRLLDNSTRQLRRHRHRLPVEFHQPDKQKAKNDFNSFSVFLK
jgi:hypothetical protein